MVELFAKIVAFQWAWKAARDFCKKLNHKETYMIFFVTLEGVLNDFAPVFCMQNTLVKE